MKVFKLLSVSLFLFSIAFAQSKNLEGKWTLTEYNSIKEELTQEKFPDCFWCQLDDNFKFIEVGLNSLTAILNQYEVTYELEFKNSELLLKKEQNVRISSAQNGVVNTKSIGYIPFQYVRKGRKLTLTSTTSGKTDVYVFTLTN
jgi:hypothetical protein